MIPLDHQLRRLEAVVDLSFVRELCASHYPCTGQPSIDPVVLFKMMLLGYLYGITSERRLAEECALHLAFRFIWALTWMNSPPDHSVLSKARARYGKEVFEAFSRRVLKLCVEAGLLRGEKIFADSTLVVANASLKSVVPREQLFQPSLSPRAHLERVFSENPADLTLFPERTPAVEASPLAASESVANTQPSRPEREASSTSSGSQLSIRNSSTHPPGSRDRNSPPTRLLRRTRAQTQVQRPIHARW